MSREKQIEEMAKAMCGNGMSNGCCATDDDPCNLECVYGCCANKLYNAGYRKQEWISVEERMPEDMYGKYRKRIRVLVCTKSGKVSVASRQRAVRFNKDKLEWVELDTFEWNGRKIVTHWMPLPEPPENT